MYLNAVRFKKRSVLHYISNFCTLQKVGTDYPAVYVERKRAE